MRTLNEASTNKQFVCARRIAITILANLLFIIHLTPQIQAQNPHADRLDPASLNQQGRLINLRIVPADRNLQVFLVGRKGAEVKLDQAKVSARLLLPNEKSQQLDVRRETGYFEIPTDAFHTKKARQLELRTDMGENSETFTIDLK